MQVNPQLQKNEYYVPFRITPNIEEFIGKIGIHGLFAGVMTSASLAVCS
jgi:phosphatidylinositol kinase/protein kinase (PI-3  family)